MAFSDQMIAELTNEKRSLIEQLKGYEQIQKRIEAIDLLLTSSPPNGNSYKQQIKHDPLPPKDISQPSQQQLNGYDKHWVWDDKCLFVLRLLGTAYTSQVVDKIMQLEPDLEQVKVNSKTAYSLSHLYRDGKIKVVGQTGRKYRYSL